MTIRFAPRWGQRRCGNLAVGGRLVEGTKPEEGLEGGHRGAAAVVAEDELVEVNLQVLGRDAAMGAVEPGLQVGGRPVGAGEELLCVRMVAPLQARTMFVPGAGELAVAPPAVGMDNRAGRDVRSHPGGERLAAGIRQDP